MSERLFTLAGAALAVLLLVWLSRGSRVGPEPELSRPTSRDAGTSGLLGLHHWLEQSGVPVRRLENRYTALAGMAPARGSLLVTSEPMVWPVRPTEASALRAWVERGNSVLLLRGAVTRPWEARDNAALGEALDLRNYWVRLPRDDGGKRVEGDAEAGRRQALCSAPSVTRGTISGPQRRLRPAPGRSHALLDGVDEVDVKAPLPQESLYPALGYARGDDRYWLPLLCDPQRKVPVFIGFRLGDGRIWALDYGEAFSNDNLGRASNARLLANLVAFAVAPDGAVIFDDMHQGVSELYDPAAFFGDPAAFFGDPRLHATLAFLLGIWLVWLLGHSNRFAAPDAPPPGTTGVDFARAVARFYARYLRPAEAARGLLRNFFNQVRARHRLPLTGEPVWHLLEPAPADAVRQLRALHARVQQDRHVDVMRLRNLLLSVQNALL